MTPEELDTLAKSIFAYQSPNDDQPIVRDPHYWWGKAFEGFGKLRFDNSGTSKESVPNHYNQLPRKSVTDGYAGNDYSQQQMVEHAAKMAALLAQPPRGGAGKRGF